MLKHLLIACGVLAFPSLLHAQIAPPTGPFYEFAPTSGFAEGWEFVGGWLTTDGQTGTLTTEMITGWDVRFKSPTGDETHRLFRGDLEANSSVTIAGPNILYEKILTIDDDGVTIGTAREGKLAQWISFEGNGGRLSLTWLGGQTDAPGRGPHLQLGDSSVTPGSGFSDANLAIGPENVATFVAEAEIPEPSTLICSLVALLTGICFRIRSRT